MTWVPQVPNDPSITRSRRAGGFVTRGGSAMTIASLVFREARTCRARMRNDDRPVARSES
jgi:hypothetical protein